MRKKLFFNDFKYETAVDLNKFPISLYTCAPISELPSNIKPLLHPTHVMERLDNEDSVCC